MNSTVPRLLYTCACTALLLLIATGTTTAALPSGVKAAAITADGAAVGFTLGTKEGF